jgi:hypothetical protein
MTLPTRLPMFLALVGAAAAVPPSASAAPAFTQRPHSRVVTYDRGEVRVLQLQATTTRSHGRLHVRVAVTLRNRTDGELTRYVRVGRCTSGVGPAPRCAPTTTFAITLHAGQTRAVTRAVALRQPPPGVDAFEVTIGKARRAPRAFHDGDAELLLKGNAWRGAGAGRAFGVRFPAGDDRARRLSLDVPELSPGHAYVFAKWEGTAAPAAPTTFARCTGDDCAAQVLKPQRTRSRAERFASRFGFAAEQATAVRLAAASSDGAPLIEATLPWPDRPY